MTTKPSSDYANEDRPMPAWLKALEQSDRDTREREQRHFAEPHISAAQHSRSRRLALGAEVLGKTSIYLDQKYWIYCRDAMMGRPQKPIHTSIWNSLKALVESNRVVCPVTYPIFAETSKQGNVEKRRRTAKVIDALSRGVAIQPFTELIRIELYHLLESHLKGVDAVYPLRRLVWTYAGWVMGEMIPHSPAFDDATNNAIQKCMFDRIAIAPFSTIIEATASEEPPRLEDNDEYYAKMNTDTVQHQHEVTSFEAVFQSEVAGFLDTIRPEITSLLAHQFSAATKQSAPVPDSPEAVEATRRYLNLIYHACRLWKLTTQFPALHIYAGIHAAVRSRTQPHKKGDQLDHLHAHAALGYCNAFFTEKNLGHLLSSPPLEYAAAYGCRVLWNDDDVLSYVKSLSPQNSPG